MRTKVRATTLVVKTGVGDTGPRWVQPAVVETLVERIEWILETRGWSERELARRAGLKHESHVGTPLRRLRKDPTRGVELDMVLKIARAAGVTIQWLAANEGSPDADKRVRSPDPCPERGAAIRAARELGLSEQAIDEVRDEVIESDEPLTALWWFDRIQARHTLRRLDDVAPKTPPKKSGRYPSRGASVPGRKSSRH